MNNKKVRGMGGTTFLFIVVIAFIVYWFASGVSLKARELSYEQFYQVLQEGQIASVKIEQN